MMKKIIRGGSRTAVTSKVELFVIIVNSFQPLTIITKRSTLDLAEVLDLPLVVLESFISSRENLLTFPRVTMGMCISHI